MQWQHGAGTGNAYAFAYDNLGRLTSSTRHAGGVQLLSYTERDLAYDRNGNITTLKRYGSNGGVPQDNFSYSYNGNSLASITGSISAAYSHDQNGNMTFDGRKNLQMSYNLLNLPQTVNQAGMQMANYRWMADGTKASVDGDTIGGQGYCYLGSMVYSRSAGSLTLESVSFGQGMVLHASGTYSTYYNTTDHLASIRVITDQAGTVAEQNDYYPFGKRTNTGEQYLLMPANRYKFNGKELQTIANMEYLDYGARLYDPTIARWLTRDPLADDYYSLSPYGYCANNPIIYIDPDGRKIVDANGNIIYTHSGGWAKNAPSDAVRLGNAMMNTKTGNSQFNKMVDTKHGITLNISQKSNIYKINGKTAYKLGEASKSVSYDPNTGDYTINSVDITVFEGTLNEYLDKANSSKADAYRVSTENNDQAIGAIGAHESVHATDPHNIKESIENKVKGTLHDIEKEPNRIEFKVLNEQHRLNIIPLKPITRSKLKLNDN